MIPSPACLNLVKRWEGLRLGAYLCPAGVLTIGYGHTGPDVRPHEQITEEAAELLLRSDMETAARAVNALGVELTQMEFDALCSFVFNVGVGHFHSSTLRKLLLAGDFKAAAAEFPKWCHGGGGAELPGLVKRRAAEMALFQSTP